MGDLARAFDGHTHRQLAEMVVMTMYERDEAIRQRDELAAALRLAVTWLPIEKMVRDPDWREQLHTIRTALLLVRDRASAPPEAG